MRQHCEKSRLQKNPNKSDERASEIRCKDKVAYRHAIHCLLVIRFRGKPTNNSDIAKPISKPVFLL